MLKRVGFLQEERVEDTRKIVTVLRGERVGWLGYFRCSGLIRGEGDLGVARGCEGC